MSTSMQKENDNLRNATRNGGEPVYLGEAFGPESCAVFLPDGTLRYFYTDNRCLLPSSTPDPPKTVATLGGNRRKSLLPLRFAFRIRTVRSWTPEPGIHWRLR
jgi:hypothetical protein